MLELDNDTLHFSFPEVHKDAKLSISFQRTLRIPDDGRRYSLPPGFGNFPLRYIEDYEERVPDLWLDRGGVIMPMYQKEALWLCFSPYHQFERDSAYPFAVKIYTGKINAVTGREYRNGLQARKQDYLVVPGQPWLDGYCVEEGLVRQFVAMPLGEGYSAEEQITGAAEWGGIQIVVYPMDADEYEHRFPKRKRKELQGWGGGMSGSAGRLDMCMCMCRSDSPESMGIAPGGKMNQDIYQDAFGLDVWDQKARSRCYVHILNSQDWRAVTGEKIPYTPISEKTYSNAGFPWFDYYDESLDTVTGAAALNGLKSLGTLLKSKKVSPPQDDDDASARRRVIKLGAQRNRKVVEGEFWEDSV